MQDRLQKTVRAEVLADGQVSIVGAAVIDETGDQAAPLQRCGMKLCVVKCASRTSYVSRKKEIRNDREIWV